MALTKLDKNLNIVSALDNEPNDVSGLTSEELKAKFDEGGKAIQEYINETLIPETEAAVEEVRGEIEGAVAGATENLESQLRGVVLGQIPDDTITAEKLAPDVRERSYTKEETDAAIETVDKIGDIKTTIRDDLGDKWLLCDGSAIDAEAYPELAALHKFSMYDNFFEEGLVTEGSILDIYANADLSMVATRGADGLNLIVYIKQNGGEWESSVIKTFTGNYTISRARISEIENGIFILYDTYHNGSKHAMYIARYDKTTGEWTHKSDAVNYNCYSYYIYTPIRYDGTYYMFGYKNADNSYVYLTYATDWAGTWSLGLNTGNASYAYIFDVGYFKGYYSLWVSATTPVKYLSSNISGSGNTSKKEFTEQNFRTKSYYGAVAFAGDTYYFAYSFVYDDESRTEIEGIEIRTAGKNSLGVPAAALDSERLGRIEGTRGRVQDIAVHGDDIYIMTDIAIYAYNLKSGLVKSFEFGKEFARARLNLNAEKNIAAIANAVFETKPSLPRLDMGVANTFIKAKM